MIDHLTVKVSDYTKSRPFYLAALAPLGYAVTMEYQGGAGFGAPKPDLWIAQDPANVRPLHVAFAAKDRATVDAFYSAAMAAGGRDNGPPGIRKDYHENYYAAFVYDPDGHNVEVVCHRPPAPARRARPARKSARKPARKATARRPGKRSRRR